MTHVTRRASLATDTGVDRFRRLILAALCAGATSGLVLFAVQHVTIVPLIAVAEGFEDAAELARTASGHVHEDEGWQPAPGLERIGLTAATTMFSGIGFAAILLAAMAMNGKPVTARLGVFWGLAGFACFVLAPALSLPPKPPGAAVGDLHARQLWWVGTILATAVGLWLLSGRHTWWSRAVGVLMLVLPHALGPPSPDGIDIIPPELMRDFALLSVGTNLLFWLVLGAMCGWLLEREARRTGLVAPDGSPRVV
jgi:cobalt transporter subunit CbtA